MTIEQQFETSKLRIIQFVASATSDIDITLAEGMISKFLLSYKPEIHLADLDMAEWEIDAAIRQRVCVLMEKGMIRTAGVDVTEYFKQVN